MPATLPKRNSTISSKISLAGVTIALAGKPSASMIVDALRSRTPIETWASSSFKAALLLALARSDIGRNSSDGV